MYVRTVLILETALSNVIIAYILYVGQLRCRAVHCKGSADTLVQSVQLKGSVLLCGAAMRIEIKIYLNLVQSIAFIITAE